MNKVEKVFLAAGIAVIAVTNVIGALQHSADWLFGGIAVGLALCAYSHIIGNREDTR